MQLGSFLQRKFASTTAPAGVSTGAAGAGLSPELNRRLPAALVAGNHSAVSEPLSGTGTDVDHAIDAATWTGTDARQ